MKIYVATAFGNFREASSVAAAIETRGHRCTSTWIEAATDLDGVCEAETRGYQRAANAALDDRDLRRSDGVIVLVPPQGGTGMWLEMGIALGLGIPVAAIGPLHARTIFGYLPEIRTWQRPTLTAIDHVIDWLTK